MTYVRIRFYVVTDWFSCGNFSHSEQHYHHPLHVELTFSVVSQAPNQLVLMILFFNGFFTGFFVFVSLCIPTNYLLDFWSSGRLAYFVWIDNLDLHCCVYRKVLNRNSLLFLGPLRSVIFDVHNQINVRCHLRVSISEIKYHVISLLVCRSGGSVLLNQCSVLHRWCYLLYRKMLSLSFSSVV